MNPLLKYCVESFAVWGGGLVWKLTATHVEQIQNSNARADELAELRNYKAELN